MAEDGKGPGGRPFARQDLRPRGRAAGVGTALLARVRVRGRVPNET